MYNTSNITSAHPDAGSDFITIMFTIFMLIVALLVPEQVNKN